MNPAYLIFALAACCFAGSALLFYAAWKINGCQIIKWRVTDLPPRKVDLWSDDEIALMDELESDNESRKARGK